MYHVIVNPASKSGLAKKQWKELEPLLPSIQGKFILHYEQKTVLKLVQKGLLYSDEDSMPLGIGTNFKREQRLFD